MNFELWKWTGLYAGSSCVWYLFYNDKWYYWHVANKYEPFEGWKRAFPCSRIKEDASNISSSPLDFLVQTGRDFYKTLEGLE
jgi:hypothetical protein